MRLYLSPYRIGDGAGALSALPGSGKRAASISNALDGVPARTIDRREVHDPHAELASLGISAEGPDLIWAVGGNAFVLRRAMRQSGFDRLIVEMLDRDDIVYGGFSAGAVVAAPTPTGLELMDDPAEVPPGYAPDPVWDGVGLIVPHVRSSHPEAAAEGTRKHFAARGVPHRALRDGEVIVRTGPRNVVVPAVRRIA